MAAFRKKPPAVEAKPRALVAAAARYDFGGAQTWRTFRGGDQAWQADAWLHYDICGELRYAVNWLGNAGSLASLYVADVDPDTGEPAQPTENQQARAIGRTVLGGPAVRSQHLKTMIVNMSVPGEFFLLVRSEPDGDRWMVMSSTEVTGGLGGDVMFNEPLTGESVKITPDDLLLRVWSPHPRVHREPDSSVRALIPTLREIERTSQNIAARLDSRLASAGLLILPDDVDFPVEDDDPAGAEGFMMMMARSMTAAMRDHGSAASQVPIIVTMPGDSIASVKHLTFETEVSGEVITLRKEAIERLATGMDLPSEMVTGMSDANHWSAWQVEEATYKTHLAPLLDRIADALTTGYLHPALTAAGVTNPQQYMLAFDPTAIIAEPDDFDTRKALWDEILISDAALRRAGGVGDDEIPDDAERDRRELLRLALRLPALLEDPAIAERLGLPHITVAPTTNKTPVLKDATPAADVSAAQAAEEAARRQPPADDGPSGSAADGAPVQASAALAAAIAVEHALGKAGARLLNANRLRGQYADIPQTEIHTRVQAADGQLDALLAGAWDGAAAPVADRYRLDGYARVLVSQGLPHTPDLLARWMAAAETLGDAAPAELVAAAVARG